jgi:mono/diheme cytochrome c family protein
MRMRSAVVVLLAAALAAGCRNDMQNQPKYKPQGRNDFFSDHRDARPPVVDTVARGTVDPDTTFMTGKKGGQPVATAPIAATAATLARGRERYDIYCAPCHDRVGTGNGMIVQRGFRQPPSFHIDRLRAAPDGYVFDTISNGFGVMPNYAQQVPIADRWAITLYVRALQLSQWATLAEVPAAERPALEGR